MTRKTKKKSAKQKKPNKKETRKVTAAAAKKGNGGDGKLKLDICGRRPNTQGYFIDTFISNKPQSIEQLVKLTGLPKGRIAQHLYDMTRKKFTKKDKQGKYCWA